MERSWRVLVGGQLALAVAQLPVGAWVGLSGTVPTVHPGWRAAAGGYARALAATAGWSLTGAPAALAAHAWLGLATVAVGLVLVRQAWRAGGSLRLALSVLGAAGVLAAAVAGVSTLVRGGGGRLAPMVMVTAFAAAAGAYILGLVLPRRPTRGWSRHPVHWTSR